MSVSTAARAANNVNQILHTDSGTHCDWLEESNKRLGELYGDIEAEVATNHITETNERLQVQIHCANLRAEEFITTANAMGSVCQNFESLDHDEHGNFHEMEEQAETELSLKSHHYAVCSACQASLPAVSSGRPDQTARRQFTVHGGDF